MKFLFHAAPFALALCAGTAAQAQSPAAPPAAPSPVQSMPFSSDRIASDSVLDRATAREDLSLAAQSQQAATVSRNSVSGTVNNGAVSIAGSAFQNASGLTLINANSGNNVAMNGSINVNIVITPPRP